MAENAEVIETEVIEGKGTNGSETQEGSDVKKYSDKEMNDISKKNVSKAEQKLLKSLGITDVEKAKAILKNAAENEARENDITAKTLEETVRRAVRAEVKNVLADNGFTGKKAERMIGLIDLKTCCNEKGELDSKKIEEELKGIKTDFPELFNNGESEESQGFKFGSDGESNIRLPKTKSVDNRKKWNRFNS